jgi:flagellin
LASGLRVQSAADDPSGLAIAETIQSKVAGLQQAVTNVQTAGNLLNVADAALGSVQDILQRVRSLVVESRSDMNSNGDLQNIQSEISTMLAEVNKISSDTSFNGLNLFDGTFDTTQGTAPSVTQVASPIPDTSTSRPVPSTDAVNADGLGNSGPLVTLAGNGIPNIPGFAVPAFMTFTVTGYSDNAIDPDSNTAVGPGVYVQFTAYSTDPSLGAAPEAVDTTAVPVNSGPISGVFYDAPGNGNILLNFNVANLTAADVGTSISFMTSEGTTASGGKPLYVNDGGQEGTAVAISLPNLSTNTLGVSDISVLAPAQINMVNTPIGSDSSNQYAASSAEIKLDDALDKISQVRSVVGAQSNALSDDASDASLTAVNETNAESSIRDADIGATVTDYTKNQILAQVGLGVLSQLGVEAKLLTSLLVDGLHAA